MSKQILENKKLLAAVKEGNTAVVQELLVGADESFRQDGEDSIVADVNYSDELGVTSLIWASWRGHAEIVRLLLTCPGIDVNMQNYFGKTALMCASSSGHTEIVRMLLACPNIDVSIKDKDDNLALAYAANEEIRTLITAHDAKDNPTELTVTANATEVPTSIPTTTDTSVTTAVTSTTSATVSATALATTTTTEPLPRSWLAARLLHHGFDAAIVRDSEQKLVINEGFIMEGEFLECPPTEFNRAYLTRISITALGLQRHLVKLHNELRSGCLQALAPLPAASEPPTCNLTNTLVTTVDDSDAAENSQYPANEGPDQKRMRI